LCPKTIRLLARDQCASARAPQLGEPFVTRSGVHRAGRDHHAGCAEEQLVGRVLEVGCDRLRDGVRYRRRRREAMRNEQDPGRSDEQRRARVGLVG
jgi:hypothetical protein